MANAASAANVAAQIRPPDFRKAVNTMRSAIPQKKDRIAALNGELADVWAKIEGMKVHKTAGKWFLKLDSLEADERVEILRCLGGLMDASGWPKESGDLADMAENKVVDLRPGAPKGEGGEGGDAGAGKDGAGGNDNADGDGDEGAEGGGEGEGEGDGEGAAEGAPDMKAAFKRSRQHLGGSGQPADEAPDAMDAPAKK